MEPPEADPLEAQRDRAEGQAGPGLSPRDGIDRTLVVGAVFIAFGFIPVAAFQAVLGVAFFGPLAFPAILAMVGVLFCLIATLRAIDLKDERQRNWAIALGAAGMVRLFVFPLL